ncbi:LXG domain-containing protein [Priestia aryabhattai]|uniref:LXG domain-containing protein n=1 Tax=Priestia aryabhattai TaxID=412384 RepID=A0ABD7WXA9_PRIAR|nr:LXG domain-containing protein [Priestia aryabhattai]MBY0030411.1 LXG domain-containing protein [Priestia aryabhattai]WEA44747.1 LXG domain-containing protein [Priestia aryabhattai]
MAKVLDAHAFREAILNTKRNIAVQQKMVSQIGKSVDGIIALDSSLKGEGGEKIRQFYQECHKPFLMFYSLFLTKYMTTLTTIDTAIDEVDGSKDALIHESYLENDLTKGLSDAQQSTVNLTDETNKIIGQIQDLISVSSLDDSEVVSGFNDAKKQLSDLVQKINEFDATQSQSLESISKDIQTMEQHVESVQGMLSNGARTLDVYQNGFVKTPQWRTMNKRNTDYVNFAREYPVVFQRITVESQYRNMYDLYNVNRSNSSSTYVQSNLGDAYKDVAIGGIANYQQVPSSLSQVTNKQNVSKSADEKKKVREDAFGSDGVGNMSAELSNKKNTLDINLKGSVVNTEHMDDVPSYVSQQFLAGEMEVSLPYSVTAVSDKILYGQLIGGKGSAVFSKSSFSHEKSPASLDITEGVAEFNAGYEDYGVSAGAEASIAKVEVKVEPLNWFGYEPLEEWLGIEYDPYIGVDVLIGSASIEGSLKPEEIGVQASLGIGGGVKVGFQKDE